MIKGGKAHFFDGQSARKHDVSLSLSDDRQALTLQSDSLDAPQRWALQDLRALSPRDDTSQLVLTRITTSDDHTPHDVARLVVFDPALIDIIIRTRPNLFNKDLAPGTGLKILKYVGGAIASVVLILFVILPALANTLAEVIPIKREIAFGKTVVRQMTFFLGGMNDTPLVCETPEGAAALDRMIARLTRGQNMTYEIDLTVLDHEMVNAFAAPGGQVVILRGLIDTAQSPDEIAGVLAHELGHVEARDPTRLALRSAGSAGILSLILGDVTGGTLIALVSEQVMSASYTRSAEASADSFALSMLDQANVSATGFADFFAYLTHDHDAEDIDIPMFLATHPATKERQSQAAQFAASQTDTRPVLSPKEWQALQRICD